jgi:hypothetical protein
VIKYSIDYIFRTLHAKDELIPIDSLYVGILMYLVYCGKPKSLRHYTLYLILVHIVLLVKLHFFGWEIVC